MQNQAAVEALYSATFVEDYLDCVENLPNDLQRHLSRLREFDLRQYTVSLFKCQVLKSKSFQRFCLTSLGTFERFRLLDFCI